MEFNLEDKLLASLPGARLISPNSQASSQCGLDLPLSAFGSPIGAGTGKAQGSGKRQLKYDRSIGPPRQIQRPPRALNVPAFQAVLWSAYYLTFFEEK